MDNKQPDTLQYSPEQLRSDRKKFFNRLDIRLAKIFLVLSCVTFLFSAGINFFSLHRIDLSGDWIGVRYEQVDGQWLEVESYEPSQLDPIIVALNASAIILLVASVVSFTAYPWFKKKNTKYTPYDKIVD